MVSIALLAVACSGSDGQLVVRDGGAEPTDDLTPTPTAPWERDRPPDAIPTAAAESDDDPAPFAHVDMPPGRIRVDQFGYRPGDPKVAVIADPQVGYDASTDFEAGPRYEVRRVSDDAVVFAGTPQPWSGGEVHEQSGDRGWWFDFSQVTEPGTYYVIDVERDEATRPFEIDETVYDAVLDAALRMFWFNRANTPHPPELAGPWSDEAAYVAPGQDTEARWVEARSDPSTERDLTGGWFDAGDPNKYVTFAMEPVHQLLTAYERQPEVFHDAVGIPESGNGIPDVIDEVLWETAWLERMQQEDGGVLSKVGVVEYGGLGIPSHNGLTRYYEEACSSSTIAAAGMFAHAAIVAASVPELQDTAPRLGDRAVSAWDWYQANEKRDDCDAQIVKSGDADLSLTDQEDAEVVAAVYLWLLTGDSAYDTVIRDGFDQTIPFTLGLGQYGPEQSDALLLYRAAAGADPATVAAIDRLVAWHLSSSPTFGVHPGDSLYRSFMPDAQYHWGSNRVKANIGSANLAIDGVGDGEERALDHLHYFHGVNPLDMVYLSNMDFFGAERSAERLFHHWFGERTAYDVDWGSEFGVAPGFVVGGPNAAYSGSEAPPAGQPPMKSYRDWYAYGSDPAWEITEPGIYYQAAYVRLLAEVLAAGVESR